MPVRLARGLAVVLAAVSLAAAFISGCADRLYEQKLIQPEGPSGQACLDRCARFKDECQARQTLREQECAARVAAAKTDFELCKSSGSRPCSPPESCLGADMSICQRQYEDCFSACGGRVERQLRARPWESPSPSPTPPDSSSKEPAA
ncbi:MAG: hypothetical protein ACM3ST_11220 [Bdellovibrio bacteriovorus]